MFEYLESRRLLSVTLSDRVLIVEGTDGDDEIRFFHGDLIINRRTLASSLRLIVEVNDQTSSFDVRSFDTVIVSANGGNDRVRDHRFGGVIDVDPEELRRVRMVVLGGAGNDTLRSGSDSDQLFGGAGDDRLVANGRSAPATRPDLLHGGTGNDTLLGSADDDRLIGGAGEDLLRGRGGHDTLRGRTGDDTLFGGTGRDLFPADPRADGTDAFTGGPGIDSVDYSARFLDPVDLSLDDVANDGAFTDGIGGNASTENDNIHGDVERLIGTRQSDVLAGNAEDNELFGLGGDDTLRGGAGDDTLVPDFGVDHTFGDAGDDHFELFNDDSPDTLDGGNGRDFGNLYPDDNRLNIEIQFVVMP